MQALPPPIPPPPPPGLPTESEYVLILSGLVFGIYLIINTTKTLKEMRIKEKTNYSRFKKTFAKV